MAVTEWIRSRRCSSSACIQVRSFGDHVQIRDSAYPERRLRFTRAEWDAFVQGVRDGDFDEISRQETT